MNNSTQSILRAILKIGGGALLTKGLIDENGLEQIIAGLLASIGLIAGIIKAKSATAKGTGPVMVLAFAILLPALLMQTGCVTGPDGAKKLDLVKAAQAKALIEPIAASGIRRALQNSPEHAPQIAKYAASFAGVFCTMTLSNSFQPEFLITEVDKFADPELAKIGDGYLIDIKNTAIGLYKVFYGDRFRAEVPPDQWLHLVCEFFCDAITQGLTDAGYPGGVKKTTADYHRDVQERMNLSRAIEPTLIREPEAWSAAVLPTPSQAPPVFVSADQLKPELQTSEVWGLSRQ